MEIFHFPAPVPELSLAVWICWVEGVASSNKAALPQAGITQSGASRSVAPAIERSDLRLWELRKRESVNWYLSMKRYEGRVRWVCSLHVLSGGVRSVVGRERRIVGWRPVGWEKALV